LRHSWGVDAPDLRSMLLGPNPRIKRKLPVYPSDSGAPADHRRNSGSPRLVRCFQALLPSTGNSRAAATRRSILLLQKRTWGVSGQAEFAWPVGLSERYTITSCRHNCKQSRHAYGRWL